MLARLQQVTTLGLILAAALWAGWLLHAGEPLWAVAGSALIVFGYAIFLGIEFLLLRVVNRDDPAPPASARQLLRAWCGEVWARAAGVLLAPAVSLARGAGLAAAAIGDPARRAASCWCTASSATADCGIRG